jgi:hypothetical protein
MAESGGWPRADGELVVAGNGTVALEPVDPALHGVRCFYLSV